MNSVEEKWLDGLDPEVLRRRRERVALIAGALLLFAIAGVLAYLLNRSHTSTDDILLAAQYGVRRSMDFQGQLMFNTPQEAQIVPLGDQKYEVRGWVVEIGGNGTARSYFYSLVVDRDPDRRTDSIWDVALVPRY